MPSRVENPMILNVMNVCFPNFPHHRKPRFHDQMMELDCIELKLEKLLSQMRGMVDDLGGNPYFEKAKARLNDAINAVDDLVEELGVQ